MERCSILFTSCPSTAAASAFARIVKMFALGVAVVMMVLDQHRRKNAFPSQVQSDDKSFTFPDARCEYAVRLRTILHSLSHKAITRNFLMFCMGSRLHVISIYVYFEKFVSCPFFHLHGFLTSAIFFFMLFHHPQPPHQPFQHPSRSATPL